MAEIIRFVGFSTRRNSLVVPIAASSMTVKSAGTKTSDRSVEASKPPMTAIAIGARNSPPSPKARDAGIMPADMAIVVMTIGLARLRQASMIASRRGTGALPLQAMTGAPKPLLRIGGTTLNRGFSNLDPEAAAASMGTVTLKRDGSVSEARGGAHCCDMAHCMMGIVPAPIFAALALPRSATPAAASVQPTSDAGYPPERPTRLLAWYL